MYDATLNCGKIKEIGSCLKGIYNPVEKINKWWT